MLGFCVNHITTYRHNVAQSHVEHVILMRELAIGLVQLLALVGVLDAHAVELIVALGERDLGQLQIVLELTQLDVELAAVRCFQLQRRPIVLRARNRRQLYTHIFYLVRQKR